MTLNQLKNLIKIVYRYILIYVYYFKTLLYIIYVGRYTKLK